MDSSNTSEEEICSICQKNFGKKEFDKKEQISASLDNRNILSYLQSELKVIITIPAYNEEKTIGKVVRRIKEIMDNTKYCYSYIVLVVNDGSTDNTAKYAREAGAFVFSHKENKGLAETFRTEMKICIALNGEIIVHTDADGQYKAEEIPLLIEQVEEGHDLVLGSRFKGTIENMPRMKKLGNRAFSFVLSILTRKRISDGQTGFRAFTREVASNIEIISDHTYTQEQIIRATQKRYSIKEVPVFFAKRNDGKSRLMRSPFDYAFKAWKNIFRIYFNKKSSFQKKITQREKLRPNKKIYGKIN